MGYEDVTVIIPTLNEEKNIGELIRVLSNSYKGAKVIVTDDGSTDATATIVKDFSMGNKNIKLLDRSSEKIHGLTASVVDAVKKVNTEFLVVIDGDLQHPPKKIKEIVEKLRSRSIVIGTRARVLGSWPLQRRLMSIAATNLARLRLGRRVEDPMSGFFGVRSELFKKVIASKEEKFEKQGYKVLFDLLKCAPKAKHASVYYVFGERMGGESKIGHRQVLAFLKSLMR